MNWGRITCWLWGHSWEVVDGKRHCVVCDHRPKDDGVRFCPRCGSERLMGNIMASRGYQYTSCNDCDRKFQDTTGCAVTVSFGDGWYELDRPAVDQEGIAIELEEDEYGEC